MASVCAYAVSGNYGIAPHILYICLFLFGTAWHRKAWFAEAMLGGAMVYSSIAAVHAVSLFHRHAPPIADLDIIPIYAVIHFALCVSPWVLIQSKNFHREYRGTRTVVFLWMFIIMFGCVAAAWNVRFLPEALPDCNQSYVGRTRHGQPTISASFPHSMARFVGLQRVAMVGPVVLVFLTLYLSEVKRHHQMDEKICSWRRLCRCCCGCLILGKMALFILTIVIQIICFLWAVYLLYVTQGTMWLIPRGERSDAVGQWGPFVGTAFIVIPAVIIRVGDGLVLMVRKKDQYEHVNRYGP